MAYQPPLDVEDRIVNAFAEAMETCDVDRLTVFKRDILITFTYQLGMTPSNRNKAELAEQILAYKGCFCKLRKAVKTVCRMLPAAAVLAALTYGAYKLDEAAVSRGPYTGGWSPLSSGSYIRDTHDLSTRIINEPLCSIFSGATRKQCAEKVFDSTTSAAITKGAQNVFDYITGGS